MEEIHLEGGGRMSLSAPSRWGGPHLVVLEAPADLQVSPAMVCSTAKEGSVGYARM